MMGMSLTRERNTSCQITFWMGRLTSTSAGASALPPPPLHHHRHHHLLSLLVVARVSALELAVYLLRPQSPRWWFHI